MSDQSLAMCQKIMHWNVYLDFIDNIEGVIVSSIREDYLHQSVCNTIPTVGRSFKGIAEVGCRVFNRSMTAKDDEACNADAMVLG